MKKNTLKKGFAAMMAAAMLCQTTALASPADELEAILAQQAQLGSGTLLSQSLNLQELGKNIESNGLSFSAAFDLPAQAMIEAGLGDILPNGVSLTTKAVLNKVQKAWMASSSIEDLLDITLYGDTKELALAIPQFFNGGLVLEAGNLQKLYEGSGLEALIGENMEMPDVDLRFYFAEEELGLEGYPFESMFGDITSQFPGVGSGLEVEKTQNGGFDIYTTRINTIDIINGIKNVMEEMINEYVNIGIYGAAEATEAKSEFAEIFTAVLETVGPEIVVKYVVQNGYVKTVGVELLISAAQETVNGNNQGYLQMAVDYQDPMAPGKAFDAYLVATDLNHNPIGTITLSKTYDLMGTVESSDIRFTVVEGDQVDVDQTIASATFDSATGKLDLELFEEDLSSGLKLSGTFSDIRPGQGFAWKLDSILVENQNVTQGIDLGVEISAVPEQIQAPESTWMIFDMDETDWTNLLLQIVNNANRWAQRFEPATTTPGGQNANNGAIVSNT